MKKIFTSILLLIFSLSAKSQCTDLFISEYIEGSSNNKAIEIYNPTSVTVPGGVYQIRIFANGSATPTGTINITGAINAGSTYVVAHTSANPSILALANQTSGSLQHNGNDAIQLYRVLTSTSVDVVGIIGVDPGTGLGFTVSGTANGTMDHTIIRLPNIQQPNLTWLGSAENEWTVMNVDVSTNLGAHTMNACGPTPVTADFTFADHCFGTLTFFGGGAIGGDGNYTYAWDFGDGIGTSTQQNPAYTYSTAGTFTVTLTVTDGASSSDVATHGVIVHSLPVPCTNPIPNTGNGCAPDTVEFINCSSGNGPLSYNWTFSNGNTSTAFEPLEIFNDDTAWVRFIVTDNNGCRDSIADGGDINLPDNASFNYSASSYCISETNPTPTVTGLTGGIFSGPNVNTVNGTFDLAAAGVGNHTITYTTNGPCPQSSQVSIMVTAQFDATIDPTGPFCENDTPVNLTAADAGGTWSGTGIADANLGRFEPLTAGPGMHTITYTINGTCGDVATTQITVNAQDFLTIYNNDTTICNDIFGFFLNAETGGTWSGNMVNDSGNGDGFFSSAAITPGTYYAVYSTSGTCPFEDSIAIDVYDYPVANFTFSGTLGNISFTNTSSNATTYLWDFDDTNTSTQTSPSHTFALNGTYNVCLTATNAVGCENTTCQNVNVTGLGINESSLVKWNVYPNPSNGNFTVESNSIITKISVKNVIGQNVFTKTVNANNTVISLEDVNNGFYFIELETENGKAVKRIEITKLFLSF